MAFGSASISKNLNLGSADIAAIDLYNVKIGNSLTICNALPTNKITKWLPDSDLSRPIYDAEKFSKSKIFNHHQNFKEQDLVLRNAADLTNRRACRSDQPDCPLLHLDYAEIGVIEICRESDGESFNRFDKWTWPTTFTANNAVFRDFQVIEFPPSDLPIAGEHTSIDSEENLQKLLTNHKDPDSSFIETLDRFFESSGRLDLRRELQRKMDADFKKVL